MKKSVVIKLRYTKSDKQDNWGNPIEIVEYKEIFAVRKSVSRSEFYKAATIGLKPSVVLEVYKDEYDNADGLILEGEEYTIIRTHDVTIDKVELTCERKIPDGS